jgi:hypothetical protein
MDASTTDVRLSKRLRRQWMFTAIGVVGSLALCGLAAKAVAVTYQAKAQVLLSPPPSNGSLAGLNPYLTLAGYQPFADVVASALTDPATAQSLKHEGLTATYSVQRDQSSDAALLVITTTGKSARAALSGLNLVVAQAPATIRHLQTTVAVPRGAFVTSDVISRDFKARRSYKSSIRAMVVALGVGLFATAVIVSNLDERRTRRRATRQAKPTDLGAPTNDSLDVTSYPTTVAPIFLTQSSTDVLFLDMPREDEELSAERAFGDVGGSERSFMTHEGRSVQSSVD